MKSLPPITAALSDVASALSLDAKRSPSSGGIDSWYPYYAGFSRKFAEHVLRSAPLPSGATVLDPWSGSGTTTYVADHLGFHALGFDLNPVATLVASAKLARPDDCIHVVGLARRIARDAGSSAPPGNHRDPLTGWLMPSTVGVYRAIEDAVLADLATASGNVRACAANGSLPPLASFLLLALMRAARSIAGIRTTTNPTWVIKERENRVKRSALGPSWALTVEAMANDLVGVRSANSARSENRLADAASLPLSDGEIDFALTSPPYCTRIDYVVSTSFELAALGIGRDTAEFENLRRSSMGTPLVREAVLPEPRHEWPSTVKALLNAIRTHASKAALCRSVWNLTAHPMPCQAL
jgi:hypothetical protein